MTDTPSTGSPILQRLQNIRARIAAAAIRADRHPDDITLVAVSKFHPQSSVLAALGGHQTVFGENRVQEAEQKFPALRDAWPDMRLHIIGGLQTNKALQACRIADAVETLDRPSLSDAIAKAGDRLGRLPQLFVQVNTGDEPQKSGIARQEADTFIDSCKSLFGERLVGLMCIPPEDEPSRPHFAYLAQLARSHGLPKLSMGMSGDFEEAILEGATLVRIGSAIFGPRPTSAPYRP